MGSWLIGRMLWLGVVMGLLTRGQHTALVEIGWLPTPVSSSSRAISNPKG
jgi:hypothetical protein